MLDVDFGDAKDQAMKSVRAFSMYKTVNKYFGFFFIVVQ